VSRLFGFVLAAAAGVARAAQPEVTALMEDYWRAYSRSDFETAATYLDPRDLGALQAGLLPLFLEASESKNVNVVPLVRAFFTGIPADRREDMTGPEVFAGMNYMMRDVLPAAYEALGKTRIRVDKVETGDDGTAVIEYTVKLPDGEAVDLERANLHEVRWYLRTKDSPAVTIERFRMLLGLDFETGPEVKLSPPVIGP
jgi:hypothetical protein